MRQGINDWKPCKDCHGTDFVYDHCSGDTVCSLCGRVFERGGFGSAVNLGQGMQVRLLSKPYDRGVHFQQRLAQLTCIDPSLPNWFIRTLAEFLWESGESQELSLGVSRERWGILSWKSLFDGALFREYLRLVCPKEKPRRALLPFSPSKLASHWLQIRMRLGISPWRVSLDCQTLAEMRRRYRLVSSAFDNTLRKLGEGHTANSPSSLSRKNIININYTMAQLLRLVSPSLWKEYAKFIPQLHSSSQPLHNNQRWEIMMQYCSLWYRTQADFAYPLLWTFFPITESLLENEFKFFV